MKKNDELAFLNFPTRQSSVAILLILLRFVKGAFRQLWPVFLVFFFNPGKEGGTPLWMQGFLALGFFASIVSIVAYFKFYFYVENDELVIEKGVLRKSKLNVPIDRIQTVNFKQGILHQVFNVVSIDIDTAGSVGNELSINALRKNQAVALRDYVESQKRELLIEHADEDISLGKSQVPQRQELLFQLNNTDLFKIGVSQNHLRTVGLIMAFFYGFLDDIENALNIDLFKNIDKWVGEDRNAWFLYLLVGIPIFLFISFLLTLVNTMFRHYGLKFWRTDSGFKMVSGLFTKKEQSANLQKIQLIRWYVSPIKKIFKMFAVSLSQAASVAIGRRSSIYIPGCYEPHLNAIRRTYWQEEETLEFKQHSISKLICWRQVLYMGILPTIGLIVWTFRIWSWLSLLWLLLIPLVYLLSLRYHRNWKYFLNEDGIRTTSGIFTMSHALLQWYKVQSVEIRQSIYQRRKDVANLTLFTAAGSVSIPYIELEKAQAIHDFVLYKVEIDTRNWM